MSFIVISVRCSFGLVQPEIVAANFSSVCTCKCEMSAYESLVGAVHVPFSLRYAIAGDMYLHSFLKTETVQSVTDMYPHIIGQYVTLAQITEVCGEYD